MELREARKTRDHFVDHGIVLHRTRAERIERRRRAKIPLRQAREMAYNFPFTDFWKSLKRFPAKLHRQIRYHIPFGQLICRERVTNTSRRPSLADEGFIQNHSFVQIHNDFPVALTIMRAIQATAHQMHVTSRLAMPSPNSRFVLVSLNPARQRASHS